MQQDIIIGLDISKDKIDCHIERPSNQTHIIISNDPQGYQTLLAHLQPTDYPNTHVCCEATNTYWQGIAHYLHSHAITISVVNPASIKAYGKLKLKRIKTDKQDAKLIADYCRQYSPSAWQPSSPKQTALKSLYRRICQLTQMLVADKTRLQTADDYAKPSIKRVIDMLSQEIEDCRDKIQSIIEQDATLRHQQRILQSIPSIGRQTAQTLLAITGDLHKYPTAKHLISWLGLSPVMRQSGKSQSAARMSKMGDKSLRKALYMPARTACTRSKLWRVWFDYQISRGKHPKQVYVMMMCKLIKYAYTCLKTDKPFNAALHEKRLELLKVA